MRVLNQAALPGRLLAGYAAAACGLVVLARFGWPALLPLAAILLAMAGLAGATAIALARAHVAALRGTEAAVARAARRPQAVLVPLLAASAAGCAWLSQTTALPPLDPTQAHWALAASAATAFALLVAERHVAHAAPHLPEAAALGRLLCVPVAIVALHGLVLAAATAGLPSSGIVSTVLATSVALIALELALRGLARWFLPTPTPQAARAAVDSRLLSLAARPSTLRLAEPLHDHFGIDFSRSWALAYAGRAALPLLAVLLLGTWLLSGIVLVPADRRAVAERFGAPVAVLPPGLHAVLPWPMGRAVPVEFGTIHETALAGPAPASERVPAEAATSPGADRLWQTAHPAELPFLVASESDGRQSFQTVSADIRVLYRIGLTDADAVRSVVATADPAALVRSAASRAVSASLATRTLADMLGPARDSLADRLRDAAQDEMDRLGSGLDIVAVVIEAIHPPTGAADAYHRVQAAEIAANTIIATERGRAQAALAMAGQQATGRLDDARAAAAEQHFAATADATRFAAERAAAQAGGRSFLMERTNESLVAALAGAPKTIIDRRLGSGERSVIDLRPFLPAAPAARDD